MIVPILVFVYDRKKKAGPKKSVSVELRITLERKCKYISTGIRLPARDILDKYNGILPLISNEKYNEYLKLVAQGLI